MMTNANRVTDDAAAKQRTRRLIQNGGLIDVAELSSCDSELLLGLLLQARDYLTGLTPVQINILRGKGSKRLEERRQEKAQSAEAMLAPLDEDYLL